MISPKEKIFFLLASFTCCVSVSAFPSVYRRNIGNGNRNYYPQQQLAYEPLGNPYEPVDPYNYYNYNNYNNYPLDTTFPVANSNGQWDRAEDPLAMAYYDLQEDDWNRQYANAAPYANVESTYSDLLYDPPIWGRIISEKPEESELEELREEEKEKENEAKNYYKYGLTKETKRTVTASSLPEKILATPTSTPTESPKKVTEIPKATVTALPGMLLHQKGGMKEIPLLRPPLKGSKGKKEPVIAVAQRSSSAAEKPSAYDTLRRYISLEDALKKEADKRRVQKRGAGKKQIVTDVDSLTGQLSNLKKSAF